MLKVGDIVSRAPETLDDEGKQPNTRNKLQRCRVTYVHPAGRSGRRFGACEKGRDASVAAQNGWVLIPSGFAALAHLPLITKGRLAIGVTKGMLAQADSFIEGSFGLLWMKPSGDILYKIRARARSGTC